MDAGSTDSQKTLTGAVWSLQRVRTVAWKPRGQSERKKLEHVECEVILALRDLLGYQVDTLWRLRRPGLTVPITVSVPAGRVAIEVIHHCINRLTLYVVSLDKCRSCRVSRPGSAFENYKNDVINGLLSTSLLDGNVIGRLLFTSLPHATAQSYGACDGQGVQCLSACLSWREEWPLR
jgi:hypothetical protein